MSIEVRSLRKSYAAFSVDLDFRIEDGETLVLAGPSGCGKTTALRMVAGIVAPDDGSIHLDGHDVKDVPAWKRGIGVVFQDLALFPHLSVGGNVAYGPFVRGTKGAERTRIVEACLRAARLEGYAKRRIETLSGGERQRTAIARALAASPRALLMDEPFSSLDAPLRRELRSEFRTLREHTDYPCLFVTHDREEAAVLGDRIAIMRAGRIAEIGTPRELFLAPKTAFTARFLGAGTVLVAEAIGDGSTVRSALGVTRIGLREGAGPDRAGSRGKRLILIPNDALSIAGADSALALCRARVVASTFSGERQTLSVELADGTAMQVEVPPRMNLSEAGSTVGLVVDESLLRFLEDEGA